MLRHHVPEFPISGPEYRILARNRHLDFPLCHHGGDCGGSVSTAIDRQTPNNRSIAVVVFESITWSQSQHAENWINKLLNYKLIRSLVCFFEFDGNARVSDAHVRSDKMASIVQIRKCQRIRFDISMQCRWQSHFSTPSLRCCMNADGVSSSVRIHNFFSLIFCWKKKISFSISSQSISRPVVRLISIEQFSGGTGAQNGLIISAKKYLKMPAATEQPAAKKERDDLLWQALKEHILRERQKKKEGNVHHRNVPNTIMGTFPIFRIRPLQSKRPKWKRNDCVKNAKNGIVKMPWHWARQKNKFRCSRRVWTNCAMKSSNCFYAWRKCSTKMRVERSSNSKRIGTSCCALHTTINLGQRPRHSFPLFSIAAKCLHCKALYNNRDHIHRYFCRRVHHISNWCKRYG